MLSKQWLASIIRGLYIDPDINVVFNIYGFKSGETSRSHVKDLKATCNVDVNGSITVLCEAEDTSTDEYTISWINILQVGAAPTIEPRPGGLGTAYLEITKKSRAPLKLTLEVVFGVSRWFEGSITVEPTPGGITVTPKPVTASAGIRTRIFAPNIEVV